jgi:hypothetical protein
MYSEFLKDDKTIDELVGYFLTDEFEDYIKDFKYGWGTFDISNDLINTERWGCCAVSAKTVLRYGKILNDTTYLIEEFHNNYSGGTSVENDTFRFKYMSQKPDSTNIFID